AFGGTVGPPREGECTAEDAEQHADDEAAEIGGEEGGQGEEDRHDAVEGALREVQPSQDTECDQRGSDEVAGDSRDSLVDEERQGGEGRRYDLGPGEDRQESSPRSEERRVGKECRSRWS